ncbi:glycosyltransferase family 1 protein [Rhizobium redzepovicii]|uniref:Glycosyltransferase family 1 protein n=1 Tax=Rhizobium redzepovicii TaxID=2867518 RepID=A0AAW8P983_9HYPH|nr:glycosyltransferase family 1 protein [Rhizobium redzepovicii]MDR9763617.1 glycosyltransferase family 1 protein [Rhizobium redzepovicii]
MKIGFFFNDPSPHSGGVFTYQQDIFRSFLELAAKSHHEFHVICEHHKQEDFSALPGRPDNVHISPMDAPEPPLTPRRRVKLFVRRLLGKGERAIEKGPKISRAAAVLVRNEIEFTWSIGHYEHEAFDVPYITTVFDLQHRLQPWFPEVSLSSLWDIREEFFSRYVRRAAYVITGTEEGRREIENFYRVPAKRIRVLPLPTPSFCFNPPAADTASRLRALGITSRYLYYPAQFWAHKNHANLLHALRLINDGETEPFQLALVGSDHGNLDHLRSLARTLGVEQQVLFLGFVAREDLTALYQGAFALTYPSLFGPDNLPPLEAFALGCPVIASDYDGAREQLENAALYVDALAPDSIAAAVRQLQASPELRQQMIEKGHIRARKWTARDYVQEIFSILDEFEPVRRCWH